MAAPDKPPHCCEASTYRSICEAASQPAATLFRHLDFSGLELVESRLQVIVLPPPFDLPTLIDLEYANNVHDDWTTPHFESVDLFGHDSSTVRDDGPVFNGDRAESHLELSSQLGGDRRNATMLPTGAIDISGIVPEVCDEFI